MKTKNRARWASDVISRFSGRRILVLGDLMLDRYIYGDVERISPEAPVPVVAVREEKYMPGGSANVAANVQSLGGEAALSGIVGADVHGDQLLQILGKSGVITESIAQVPGLITTVKTRILAGRQQVVRVDWDGKLDVSDDVMAEWYKQVEKAVREADGVIFEDYGKGLIHQELVDVVLDVLKGAGVPSGLDPKQNFDLDFKGITVATPNRREAFLLAGVPETTPVENPLADDSLKRVAHILGEKWECRFLTITLGAQGMILLTDKGEMHHIPTQAREVFDVSGAGDTVIATMLLALAAGANCDQATELANCAAGVVVGKVGTASCTKDELMAFLELLMDTGVDTV